MKSILVVLFFCSVSFISQSAEPIQKPAKQDGPLKARFDLTDGSRIMGTVDHLALPIHSESIGDLKIPLKRIAGIKFQANKKFATITMTNRDRLEGVIQLASIPVATTFGVVRIPLDLLREIQLGRESSASHGIKLRSENRNYIEIPASADFDVTENWTLEFWANITGGRGEAITPLLRAGDDCGSAAAIQADVKTGQGPTVTFYATDTNGDFPGITRKMDLMDGRWHHWAGVVNDGQLRFYIDGKLIGSKAYKAGATGSRCPLRFGYRATHGGCFVDGTFAEIRISRVARYTEEFRPATGLELDAETIGYWRFNEGEGDKVRDETGKHDGILRGDAPPERVPGFTLPDD